jgi:transcriptional regulator with XRE-family HTH domain
MRRIREQQCAARRDAAAQWFAEAPISQARMARELGCSRQYMTEVKYGRCRLTDAQLSILETLTGVPFLPSVRLLLTRTDHRGENWSKA